MTRLRDFYRQHYWFLVVLVLFASFRFFAILLFRWRLYRRQPDYGSITRGFHLPMGYTTFVDLWTAYLLLPGAHAAGL